MRAAPRTQSRGSETAGRAVDARGLTRTGAGLALLYLLYALLYPEREARALRHVFGWLGTAALLLLWLRGMQQIVALERHGRVPWRRLAGFFVLFAVLAAAIRPFHSSDLHAYVNVGHLQAAHGLNPYTHTPGELPGWERDPMIAGTWKDTPCAYGFLFAELSAAVAWVADGDPGRARLLFKLLSALALAATAWLTVSTLRRLGRDGAGFAAFTLLWSPFVVLHFVANAHNDVWMALWLVAAVRLALDGRWWGVVPAVVAGVLVKHVALVLLPFAWLHLVRRHGWRRTLLSTAAGGVLAVAAAWPYVGDLRGEHLGRIADTLTTPWNSLQAVLTYGYGRLAELWGVLAGSADAFTTGVRIAFGAGFLVFHAGAWLRSRRRSAYGAADWLEDGVAQLFVLLCVASAAWHPWYLGMFLPLALLLPRRHLVRELTLWVLVFQMAAFTPLAKARMLEALLMLGLPMVLVLRHRRRTGTPWNWNDPPDERPMPPPGRS